MWSYLNLDLPDIFCYPLYSEQKQYAGMESSLAFGKNPLKEWMVQDNWLKKGAFIGWIQPTQRTHIILISTSIQKQKHEGGSENRILHYFGRAPIENRQKAHGFQFWHGKLGSSF